MASKYELTISTNYVSNWGIVEAVRELFQNAIDNEITNPGNEMYFNYDKETQTLRIGNKTSCLTVDTLLLGSSSKRDDTATIGKHGEGYKVGFVVLLREGKTITVYNYGAKEVWTTKLVNSRRFGSQVPTIFVDKVPIWKKVPSHDLMIEIGNITEEEYLLIKESNLHLQEIDKDDILEDTSGSRILLNDKYAGKIFVRGLYICTNHAVKKGYDFAPNVISLDRDRQLVDTFNLSWESSRLWNSVVSKNRGLYLDLLNQGAADVQYVTDMYTVTPDKEVKSMALRDFLEENGEDSVPVANNDELSYALSQGKKPVMVSKSLANIIKGADDYEEIGIKVLTPKEDLQKWFESIEEKITDTEIEEFTRILNRL